MRNELGESFEHFRTAVSHARGGAADAVGPRVEAARKQVGPALRKAQGATLATMEPIADAALNRARQAGKAARKGKRKLMREEPRVRRGPMILGGLLAAGAAVGIVGAFVARRRSRNNQWEQYGTTRTTAPGRTDSTFGSSARSTVESGKEKVQSLAESAKERAAELRTGTTSTDTTTDFGSREDLYGRSGSNNNRS